MKIIVIGLGYVGLPLAIALARQFEVIGFDIESERVEQLRSGFDRTREVEESDLAGSSLSQKSASIVSYGIDTLPAVHRLRTGA